ncbi:MAG: PAS domain-containing protein [Treponema sp.]|nr:PAS domain-containing protein [Treponema sp.]
MQEFSKRVSQKVSKLSDLQIKNLLDELSESSDMLDSIFQSIPTGLLIVSNSESNFRILKVNKAAERYIPFKLNPRETAAESVPVWNTISDSDISGFLKATFESKKTNVSDEFSVRSSGGIRFVDISISPFARKNELVGSIVRIEDVTEKRNQEILLHRMEAMAGLTNIAANVAHEIKNPLGAISIHIQLIQKAVKKSRERDGLLPDPKFVENYLDVVNSEIDRLNKIVVDFLMAVRPISVNLELVNPNSLLEAFVEFFRPEFTAKNVVLESDFCRNAPRILIDPKLFREVIVNFAQNSLAAIQNRFTGSGGRISIQTRISDGKFVLRFSDNGSGMDNEVCARVFEPYFTTKANGTGLGMAMSYKIIKEFSGDIEVSSALGEGTEFVVTLPIPQQDRRLLSCDCDCGCES